MSSDKSRFNTSETPPREQPNDRLTEYETRLLEVVTLVARVRHEINNPLTGVLGHAQLLLREDLSDKVKQRVLKIEELALRLAEIVAELRSVQSLERPTAAQDTATDPGKS
jgi:signal transduction histidine kinase